MIFCHRFGIYTKSSAQKLEGRESKDISMSFRTFSQNYRYHQQDVTCANVNKGQEKEVQRRDVGAVRSLFVAIDHPV